MENNKDMERSIHGNTPDDIVALVTNMQRIQAVLIQNFGNESPQATEIKRLLAAMYEKHNYPTPE